MRRAGGSAGLTALFRDHQPRLLRFLRSQESRVADDLAAETWLAVAGGLKTFTGDERDFRAWLFTIARHRLADHRRRSVRRRTTPMAEVPELAPGKAPQAPDDEVLASLGAQDAVDLIVSRLKADQAEVVLLRTLGDLRPAEIAGVMGRSENWVRVTHHRAMARLRAGWSA